MADTVELGSESQNHSTKPQPLSEKQSSQGEHGERWSTKKLKTKIASLFGKINCKSDATFATSNALYDAPLPGLFVKSYGVISLPLTEVAAHDLMRQSRQVSAGADTSILDGKLSENFGVLNASQFELRNPRWGLFLDRILDRVSTELGIVGGRSAMRANPYKLLLYGEGAYMEKQRDAASNDGDFGMLVIALPTEHHGGEVVATFGSQTKTLSTSISSAHDFSYLAWYDDVECTLQTVTFGFQFALAYKLTKPPSCTETLSAQSIVDANLEIQKFFLQWERELDYGNDDMEPYMVYALENRYTEADIRSRRLKGKDKLVASALKHANDRGEASFLLANLERSVSGTCYDGENDHYDRYNYDDDGDDDHHSMDEDEEGVELTLQVVVKPDGTKIATDMQVGEEVFVQPFDSDRVKEYFHRRSAELIHYYRRSCIIVMPKNREYEFDLTCADSSSIDIQRWATSVLRDYERSPTTASLEKVSRVSTLLIASARRRMSRTSDVEIILKLAMHVRSATIFKKATCMITDMQSEELYKDIGSFIGIHTVDFREWTDGIEKTVVQIGRLSDKSKALNLISKTLEIWGRDTPKLSAVKQWAVDVLSTHLSATDSLDTDDLPVLFELVILNGEQYIFKSVLPAVKKNIHKKAFVLGYLRYLAAAGRNGQISTAVVSNVFNDLLSDVASNLDYNSSGYILARNTGNSTKRVNGSAQPSLHDDYGICLGKLTAKELQSLVKYGLQYGAYKSIEMMLQQIASTTVDAAVFESTVQPLLRELPNTLKQYAVPLPTGAGKPQLSHEDFRQLYRLTISSYLSDLVQKPPSASSSWDRPPLPSCNTWHCTKCASLNTFLTNRQQKIARFTVATSQRTHMEGRLRANTWCTFTVDRTCKPFALVVRKTTGDYEQAKRDWESRLATASSKIEEIGIDNLQQMIGNGITSPIKQCAWVLETLGCSPPLSELDTNARTSSSGLARSDSKARNGGGSKLEVVDLT